MMIKSEILNFKILLKAINKNFPTGEDLRISQQEQHLYLQLRDARQTARTIERKINQGIATVENPDWNCVFEQAIFLLSTKTKDIEISAWLCEALIRLYGFEGLKEGFSLITQIIKKYWEEQLYPMPDEEGLYTRVSALAGLNGNDTDGTLIIPIAKIPLTENKALGSYSLWQYQQACELLKLSPEKRDARIASGTPTIEMIEACASETSSNFYIKLLQNLQDCINMFDLLDNILIEKCGDDAPPTSRICAKLKDCLSAVQMISKRSIIKDENHSITEKNISLISSISPISAIIHGDDDTKRKQMLNTILEAAKYFRQTEPHSPLSYLLEKAIRWGNAPFPELLRELIKDDQILANICHLTGIEG